MKWNLVILSVVLVVPRTQGWHDLGNADFHCWPLSASADSPVPYSSCPGVEVSWVVPPPEEIKAREPFNVTYELELSDKFFDWAVSEQDGFKPNFFADAGKSGATEAKQWCMTSSCPSDVKQARADNCCIHHVNVHSCPLSQVEMVKNGLCGPWIPSDGDIFSHSEVLVGSASRQIWSSRVMGLYSEGDVSLIAHFKIVGMHLALESSVKVTPRAVCGDKVCDGDEGEACDTCPRDCGRCPLADWQIALLVLFLVLVLLGFCGVVGFFKYKQRKLLWDESWIIHYEDIKLGHSGPTLMSQSRISIATGSSTGMIEKQIFTQAGIFNGRQVAVKEVSKNDFFLSMDVRKEVKQVRSLDHPNLCKFVGGCVIQPHIVIVTEYCPKGSLNDLLLNDDVPISWAFRFSFASDIAKGTEYLHSHKIHHGHLKSSNCVVDDRWTVKVTDYGLQKYRTEDHDADPNKEQKDQIYQAPEIVEGTSGSEYSHADVYAYAVILVEIATRNEPYGDIDPSCLKTGWKPPLPDHSDPVGETCPCPKKYNDLICKCWADDPKSRITFQEVRKILTHINPDKRSPVDLMINMMEKYSKHLETLVSERTVDLEAEKAKTDRLLHSMLPQAIADQLRQGHQIEAEQFPGCTIYFSDICGFTNLSGGSTPMEVVGMLNKLYTAFDSVIDQHDVYKVETIGDAYMVVSGVPKVNGDMHAAEICNMALELVAAAKSFVIPHKPHEPLRIRVGIHTGPVCAGVVGLKMPRYCLFGDTVNTASRMESNGEAYRVHLSETTCALLQKIGGYMVQKRGTVTVKGKGEMITYWLNGRKQSEQNTQDETT